MSTRSTRSPRRVATVAGGLSVAVTLVLRLAVFPYQNPGTPLWELPWMTLGAFALLAVPAYLYAAHGVIAPVTVVVGTYALAVRETWEYFGGLGPSDPGAASTPTILTLYLVFWAVPLAAAAAVGGAEYGPRALGARRGGAEV
ncbi:hypothetical protein [Halorubrum sp. Atlit-28R]|uniref:hypothetical protein n=1 Tax=Halorubrum sp. Atlit-28R TaxID=2282129 RepID=UPI000EF21E20|nr:hypothetical protein [Halorubrum sp. Atlit-28R]RLM50247.1 hypothetical protein DVK06_11450 [Halorubrum sp. Atlit-28R]